MVNTLLMPATQTAADLTMSLGSRPFTWQGDEWAAERFDFAIDGKTWTVSLTLDEGKVRLYAYNSDGANLHGPMAYNPEATIYGAMRVALVDRRVRAMPRSA